MTVKQEEMAMELRQHRGNSIPFRELKTMVNKQDDDTYIINSSSYSDMAYEIIISDEMISSCSCPDYEKRAAACKHMFALARFLRGEFEVQMPRWLSYFGGIPLDYGTDSSEEEDRSEEEDMYVPDASLDGLGFVQQRINSLQRGLNEDNVLIQWQVYLMMSSAVGAR